MENYKLDQLRFENKNLYQQLVFADGKHAVIVGLVGALIMATISINIEIINVLWGHILLGAHTIMLFFTMLISMKAFFPNVKKQNKKRAYNLYFFEDIKNFNDYKDYLVSLDKMLDDDQECEHIAEQNIILSSILNHKYLCFKWAVHFFISSFFLPYLLVIIILYIKTKIKQKVKK